MDSEQEERQAGVRFCQRHGFPETARMVREYECHRIIMQTLADEAGHDGAVKALVEEGNPGWIYRFACHVEDLTEKHIDVLVEALRDSGNNEWAYSFAYGVEGLTEGQMDVLVGIVCDAGNPRWARYFVCYVGGLTRGQREQLFVIK